jgi:hypothetical protein
MVLDIMGKEKVVYEEGALVGFDTTGRQGKGGSVGGAIGVGTIVGQASENVIDMWIVKVQESIGIDPKVYPYSCIVVPHYLLWPAKP